MAKGNGGSRSNRGNNQGTTATNTVSSSQALPTTIQGLQGIGAAQMKSLVSKMEDTAKAIVNSGATFQHWNVLEAAQNKVLLQSMLGADADSNLSTIDNTTVRRVSASQLSQYNIITDGTRVFIVDRVNKDGSVRATTTIYNVSSGGSVRPIGDTVKFTKNDPLKIITGYGSTDYLNAYRDHRYKMASQHSSR